MSMHPSKHRIASIVGTGLALVAFLLLALRPAVSFGAHAGALLAGGILGGRTEGLIARALILFGSVLGVAAVGSLFVVAGSVTGAAAGALVGAVRSARRAFEEAEPPPPATAAGSDRPPVTPPIPPPPREESDLAGPEPEAGPPKPGA
jgi:hypothetical protein